jgi:hypothetical protein
MCLDFSCPDKLVVSMESYVISMIEEMPEDMNGTSTTPASTHHVNTTNPVYLKQLP